MDWVDVITWLKGASWIVAWTGAISGVFGTLALGGWRTWIHYQTYKARVANTRYQDIDDTGLWILRTMRLCQSDNPNAHAWVVTYRMWDERSENLSKGIPVEEERLRFWDAIELLERMGCIVGPKARGIAVSNARRLRSHGMESAKYSEAEPSAKLWRTLYRLWRPPPF